MLIALDYDGTYTLDPEFWNTFIINSKKRNHKIIIVTMRYPHEGEEVEEQIKECSIIYTSRKAKKSFLERMGIFPDVWIDDNPEWIYIDSI